MSTVTRAADLVLYTASPRAAIVYAPPGVRKAQLALVDVLYEALRLKEQEPTRGTMARVAQAISEQLIGSRPAAR